MTRADIETMLNELAATTRHLQDSGRLMRRTAEHLVTYSEYVKDVSDHVSKAVTAGLSALSDDDDEK